ncbi:unannotated protein [freshwater metagenome]|uniref:Unannotated protein n=1 Tax=freshwater metagenome TaxID=449393 RepID=A0A6J6TGP1_9ZZZZ
MSSLRLQTPASAPLGGSDAFLPSVGSNTCTHGQYMTPNFESKFVVFMRQSDACWAFNPVGVSRIAIRLPMSSQWLSIPVWMAFTASRSISPCA